jgi:hypothetical protein
MPEAEKEDGKRKRGPDIIIDGHVGEIKHVFTKGKRTITNALVEARQQNATSVLMEITDKIADAHRRRNKSTDRKPAPQQPAFTEYTCLLERRVFTAF